MKQVAAVGIGQEIALQLDTDIAAVAGVGTSTVIETCDGGGNLAVAHEPLVYWVHGILKREWTLELSCLYLEVTIFLPLRKKVNDTGRIAKIRGVAIKLNLGFPIKVIKYTAIEAYTCQSQVERVGLVINFAATLVLYDAITR